MIHYSPSRKGFFDRRLGNVPEDCVRVTLKEYESLMSEQLNGFEIVPNKEGFPTLKKPVVTREQKIIQSRKIVRSHVNRICIGLGFDSTMDAISYAEDIEESRRKTSAISIRSWRSKVMNLLDEILDFEDIPEREELIQMMPKYEG